MLTRRHFLNLSLRGLGLFALSHLIAWPKKLHALEKLPGISLGIRALGPPDENGVRLPNGFRSQIIARSGHQVTSRLRYKWHRSPDGGATFATIDGGWIYVSNSEDRRIGQGGAGAIRFDSEGQITDAYSILSGTTKNCAGGKTPWGSFLSCEEHSEGRVWECDPYGKIKAHVCPGLGVFTHEAASVDLQRKQIYLTEDEKDGLIYRYTAASLIKPDVLDLENGKLEALRIIPESGGQVTWVEIKDPAAKKIPTRYQDSTATIFKGGEGMTIDGERVYFTTKHDNRVWILNIAEQRLTVLYDPSFYQDPILKGVDNICISPAGEVVVAEDEGDQQLVAITKDKNLVPLLQLVGHEESEIAGPAFDPSGRRLYFSSQRGTTGRHQDGITFEVTGPFV